MKLSKSKALELHRIMKNSGFQLDDYQLFKRKGWAFIQLNDQSYFSFFHNKSTFIDDSTLQWVETENFSIKTSNTKLIEKESWLEVIYELTNWVQNKRSTRKP